jgi:hypothetical protein
MNYYIEITLILSFIFFILWLFSNKQIKKYREKKNRLKLKINRKNL